MAPPKKTTPAKGGGTAVAEKPRTAVQTTLEPPVDATQMDKATQGVQKQLAEPTASTSQTSTPTNGTGSDPFMTQLLEKRQWAFAEISRLQGEITQHEALVASYDDLIGKLSGK
jgi:hypothetical protein